MKEGRHEETRPDTRPSVADGWAGAEIRVFPLFNSSVTDQRTDGPTDGRTDGASYRVACPQLKRQPSKTLRSVTNNEQERPDLHYHFVVTPRSINLFAGLED